MHPSNEGHDIPIRTFFPQAMINQGGKYIDTYDTYGVQSLSLHQPGNAAAKKIIFITIDPGLVVHPQSLKSKEVFHNLKPADIVILMWPAALHPACKWNKYMFDVKTAFNEWRVFFDQYADIVVEGGGQFKLMKYYQDVNNINTKVINTVYVGDAWISGQPNAAATASPPQCITESDNYNDIDKYRYRDIKNKANAHAWFFKIGSDTLTGKAAFGGAPFTDFTIKI